MGLRRCRRPRLICCEPENVSAPLTMKCGRGREAVAFAAESQLEHLRHAGCALIRVRRGGA
jgi:hypothetical protein